MAREASDLGGPPSGRKWRTSRQRREAHKWARLSARRLVERLQRQLVTFKQSVLALGSGSLAVGQRLLASAPALRALLSGEQPSHGQRLRRNVALHAQAEGVDLLSAPMAVLRSAQRGPRLGATKIELHSVSAADEAAGGGLRRVAADSDTDEFLSCCSFGSEPIHVDLDADELNDYEADFFPATSSSPSTLRATSSPSPTASCATSSASCATSSPLPSASRVTSSASPSASVFDPLLVEAALAALVQFAQATALFELHFADMVGMLSLPGCGAYGSVAEQAFAELVLDREQVAEHELDPLLQERLDTLIERFVPIESGWAVRLDSLD